MLPDSSWGPGQGHSLMGTLPASGPVHQKVKREQLALLIQTLVKPASQCSR